MRSYGNGGNVVGGRIGCDLPMEPFRRPESWPPLQRAGEAEDLPWGRSVAAQPVVVPVAQRRTRTVPPRRSRKQTKQTLARAAAVAILQSQGKSVPEIAEQLGISCYAVRQAVAFIVPAGSSAGGAR